MRRLVVGVVCALSIGGAFAAVSPAVNETQAEAAAESSAALYAMLETELTAICPVEALEPYFEVLSLRTSGAELETVIDTLNRLTADEVLCAPAREAARQALDLAQFALASTDDATGAIGATTNAPFSFGGAAPPGGAGYL